MQVQQLKDQLRVKDRLVTKILDSGADDQNDIKLNSYRKGGDSPERQKQQLLQQQLDANKQ